MVYVCHTDVTDVNDGNTDTTVGTVASARQSLAVKLNVSTV
jgi:hypothetical protein